MGKRGGFWGNQAQEAIAFSLGKIKIRILQQWPWEQSHVTLTRLPTCHGGNAWLLGAVSREIKKITVGLNTLW